MTIFVTNCSSFAKRGQAVSWLNVSSAAVTASSSAWPSDQAQAVPQRREMNAGVGFDVPENASLGEVVRGHDDIDPVAGDDADEVLPHLAGEQAEDRVPIVEFDPKLRVGERFGDGALLLDTFLLSHIVVVCAW